ncbi:MAG TPA: peptide deformylase [Pseudolysinimonas sp.]|nr:peptide deformylase [Pseudolysinimonas sp.]
MAVRPILITGEPVLHSRASEVGAIDDDIRALVRDMEETMAAAPGVGLAAPQVGVPLRLFVWRWTDDDGVEHRGTAINPQLWITPPPVGEPDEDADSEGCLSIPGERFALRRSEGAILRATDLEGRGYEIEAHGWLARIFQHEFDHLDGILYADRLIYPLNRLITKVIRKKSWGAPGASWTPGVDHLED